MLKKRLSFKFQNMTMCMPWIAKWFLGRDFLLFSLAIIFFDMTSQNRIGGLVLEQHEAISCFTSTV